MKNKEKNGSIVFIELSYRYSNLDKSHCFGIVFVSQQSYCEIYIRWVWYYLGKELISKPKDVIIYPFNYESKVIKKYKYCNDAKRQAVLLANAIKKQLL